ncbi:MAG TPA: hypothetical protein VJC37_06590, partial [Planctomycetota bacterium]|nr:hypothetical protein [Planctomycetota bacterium]
MKKVLIVGVIALGLGLFSMSMWTMAQHTGGGGSHGAGEEHSGGASGDNAGVPSQDDAAYQRSMDDARKLDGEKKSKE